MQINKTELKQALETVKPGLSNKEMIEQSTSFAFMGNKIVTYNDEISISHPIKGLDITGAVKAEQLYQILTKVKGDEIELELNEGEILLSAGRTNVGLKMEAKITLPLNEIEKSTKWVPITTEFIEALKFTVKACGKDMSKVILTCVHINGNNIEANDNYRMIRYVLEEGLEMDPVLIPSSSVEEVIKLKPNQISKSKSWVHFKTEQGTVLSCRIINDNYMDIESFLNLEGVELTLPKTLDEVLDRAAVFAKRDFIMDELVTINIENNKLTITSDSENGWFEETINMRFKDEPINFKIAPYLLRDIIKETNECIISENGLKFQNANWVYITCLL